MPYTSTVGVKLAQKSYRATSRSATVGSYFPHRRMPDFRKRSETSENDPAPSLRALSKIQHMRTPGHYSAIHCAVEPGTDSGAQEGSR